MHVVRTETAVAMFKQWGEMLVLDGFTKDFENEHAARYNKGGDSVELRARELGDRVLVTVAFNLPRLSESIQAEEAEAHVGEPAQCVVECNHTEGTTCFGEEHYCETHECFYIHPAPCPKEKI